MDAGWFFAAFLLVVLPGVPPRAGDLPDRPASEPEQPHAGGDEGAIRSITLRGTRIQTPGGELVTIPNDVLTSQAITRPYGHGRFQVVARVHFWVQDPDNCGVLAVRSAFARAVTRRLDAAG